MLFVLLIIKPYSVDVSESVTNGGSAPIIPHI